MKASPHGCRATSALRVDPGDLAGAEVHAILEPPSVHFLTGMCLLCLAVDVNSCRFIDTRARVHVLKCDANKMLIPAQDRVFITCNAGKSCKRGGTPAGATVWRGEAAAKDVGSHQMTGACWGCDATILLGRVQQLHLSREICRRQGGRDQPAGEPLLPQFQTSVCLLWGHSPLLRPSGKSDFYLKPRGAEEKKHSPSPPAARTS